MRVAFFLLIIGVVTSTDMGYAALAVDAGLDPRILTHLAIEETQIDALLVERGVFGEKE
jgi:hypothetical protein